MISKSAISVLLTALFIVGCDEEKSNQLSNMDATDNSQGSADDNRQSDNEQDDTTITEQDDTDNGTQEDTQSGIEDDAQTDAPGVSPDDIPEDVPPESDPTSRENLAALRSLNLEKIRHDCQPFMQNYPAEDGSGLGIYSPNNQFGIITSNGFSLWYVDELGEKINQSALVSGSLLRSDYGDENTLTQCSYSDHGVLYAFHPKLGAIGDGLADSYQRPPWLAVVGGRASGGTAYQWVSVHSDLIYRTYRVLAQRHATTVGPLDQDDVEQLYAEAISLVTSLPGFDLDVLIDDVYIDTPGGISQNRPVITKAVLEISPITEQIRFLAETTFGIDGDVGLLNEEIARQLVLNERSPNYGDKVALSIFGEAGDLMSNDPEFRDVTNNWTEYSNTESFTTGTSNSGVFSTSTRTDLRLSLTSSITRGDESLQHGFYQDVLVGGRSLDDINFVAAYSRLQGILEDGTFLSRGEDSGVAGVAMEYLNDQNRAIGATVFANATDGLFTGSGFYNAPIPLQSNGTTIVYRVPSIGNNSLIANVGEEARVSVGSRQSEIQAIRLYVFVADYMAEQLLRHFLTGIVLSTPSCNECKAELNVNSLSLRYEQP